MERLPVRSVNLGTGENGMHPDFATLLDYLRRQPIKLTITSNGYSVEVLGDAQVIAFKDVEFSLDHPNEIEHDTQRGPGNWRLIHEQAARCRRLGVPVTFIAVMMRSNFDRLADIARIAKAYDAPLRVNVYQSVRSDAYALTYEEYWRGFETLFADTEVVAIGEPLVRAMAGLPPRLGGCGVATVRVTPRATVQPCVYWPGGGAPLDLLLDLGPEIVETDAFAQARSVPTECAGVQPCCGLRRRLRRAAAADWRNRRPRSLLSDRGARQPPHPESAHGAEPRTAEAGKRLHHHRNGSLACARPWLAARVHRRTPWRKPAFRCQCDWLAAPSHGEPSLSAQRFCPIVAQHSRASARSLRNRDSV